MSDHDVPLTYAAHLQLDQLLSAQRRRSEDQGQPAHDEMLFIIVHQAYELWFKLVLFELDRIQEIFSGPVTDDREIGQALHGLSRVNQVQKLLIEQLDVLETMTPLDFLDFRDLLFPASGFQSLQFRLLETRLGLRRSDRLDFANQPYDAALGESDRQRIADAEAAPSLLDQVESWLSRTPFVSQAGYEFTEAYRRAVAQALGADADAVRRNPAITVAKQDSEVAAIDAALERFEAIFDEKQHRKLVEEGVWRLSWRALQAALFINLYRDEPVLQLPFRLLNCLMDIDEDLTTWRYRHALMAQRMIGRKVGTGGSSGFDYLRQTADRHRIFGDLFALSTYFLPRSKLPPLPEALRQTMGYSYSQDRQ